jgi:hypothetical protein
MYICLRSFQLYPFYIDYIARLKNPREHSPKSMPVCPHCR